MEGGSAPVLPAEYSDDESPSPPGAPLGGDPLSMTLAGGFLVRGDRIDRP